MRNCVFKTLYFVQLNKRLSRLFKWITQRKYNYLTKVYRMETTITMHVWTPSIIYLYWPQPLIFNIIIITISLISWTMQLFGNVMMMVLKFDLFNRSQNDCRTAQVFGRKVNIFLFPRYQKIITKSSASVTIWKWLSVSVANNCFSLSSRQIQEHCHFPSSFIVFTSKQLLTRNLSSPSNIVEGERSCSWYPSANTARPISGSLGKNDCGIHRMFAWVSETGTAWTSPQTTKTRPNVNECVYVGPTSNKQPL